MIHQSACFVKCRIGLRSENLKKIIMKIIHIGVFANSRLADSVFSRATAVRKIKSTSNEVRCFSMAERVTFDPPVSETPF